MSDQASAVPTAATTASAPAVRSLTDQQTVNPRLTQVHFEIKNSAALQALNKKFAVATLNDKPQKLAKQNEWFSDMRLSRNIDQADGEDFIIDVQPDYRFPFSFIVNSCVGNFPRLDIKSHPNVSLYTQIFYELVLFTASLLIQDFLCRKPNSFWAQLYRNDQQRYDYINMLLSCNISQDTAVLIEHFIATDDPNKPRLSFIPTLGGGKFVHDYGRLMPPQIFLAMHNLLADMRNNVPVNEVLRQLYDTLVITVNNNEYHVTHFTGGNFLIGNQNHRAQHWIREIVEDLFCPAVGRAHIQRPTLARIDVTPQVIAETSPNFYDLMLSYNDEDYGRIANLIQRINCFYSSSDEINSVPLSAVIEKAGGITILSHTIEELSFPTWHYFPHPGQEMQAATAITTNTPAQIATRARLYQDAPVFNGNLPFPAEEPDDFDRQFYQIASPDDPLVENPIQFKQFRSNTAHPDVFLFQPYERHVQRAELSTTLGLKICSEEFDAAVIPLPNIADSLYDNNGAYQVGSLPIRMVRPYIPRLEQDHGYRIIQRSLNSHEINGFAIRDGGQNIIPIFNMNNIRPDIIQYEGIINEHGHQDNLNAFTYATWRDGDGHNVPERSRTLWSSYRYVTNPGRANRAVNFYFSMRPLYGMGTPLIRMRNPSLVIPRK
jgi:hypothetical protein